MPSGVSGSYWKIINISGDRLGLKVVWTIALFTDEAHGVACTPYLMSKNFSATLTKAQIDTNLVSLGYTTILAQASTILTKDIRGNTVPPYPLDPDLDGATSV